MTIKTELRREHFGPALWPLVDEIISLRDRVTALESSGMSTLPAQFGVSADFAEQLRKVGARPGLIDAIETDRETRVRQAVEQTMPNAEVSVAVLPRGEPNIGGYDGEVIEIDSVNRLIYCTAPSYNHKPGRTGWFWQQHNIGEHWVTMADACGMDAHVARLLVEANRRLAGRYACAAVYVTDEDGKLQGPLTHEQMVEWYEFHKEEAVR